MRTALSALVLAAASIAMPAPSFAQASDAQGAGAYEVVYAEVSNNCTTGAVTLKSGTLTVVVDSASHLYELKQLLLAGLERQLLLACSASGLRKVVLRRGRWYEGDDPSDRKVRFV